MSQQQSTMKVTEHRIVTERKQHPNDVRYPCRGTHEIMDAGRKLITSLSDSERKLMLKGDLILDEEETAELYDSFQVEDVVGLGIFRSNAYENSGFSANMYIIEAIHEDEDYMECRNMYSKELEEVSFQDVSISLALGLAEILYRDDKPYGISTEQEWTIKIHGEADNDDSSNTSNAVPANGAVSGSAAPSSSDESTTEEASDEAQAEPVDASEGMFGALGVPTPQVKPTEAKVEAEETETEEEVPAEELTSEDLHPRFWNKRRKLSRLSVEKLREGQVVWGHVTTDLGAVAFKGPMGLSSVEENKYTFVDAQEQEYVFDIENDWDSYADHYKSGGLVHLLFEAQDRRPKKESEASKNDDTEKLIKSMGLDKQAEPEEEDNEPQLAWSDFYFAFGWDNGTYCVALCPKDHWDNNGDIDSEKNADHLITNVGLTKLKSNVYQYDHVYTETQLRMIFKSFNCLEKTEMADAV